MDEVPSKSMVMPSGVTGEGAGEVEVAVVAVDAHLAAVGARTQGADARQHGATGRGDDHFRQRIQGLEAELGQHRRQALAAGAVAGREGVEVAPGPRRGRARWRG